MALRTFTCEYDGHAVAIDCDDDATPACPWHGRWLTPVGVPTDYNKPDMSAELAAFDATQVL